MKRTGQRNMGLAGAMRKKDPLEISKVSLAAVELMNFVNQIDTPEIQLSDEQVAEVDRRLAKKNPRTFTMAELDDHLKRRGI